MGDDSSIETPTKSKKQMAKALTSLITTFKDETQEQDEILSQLQIDAQNNPNFGNKLNASHWSVNEVCHWLTTIDLQTYYHTFIESNIDGNILLNDITEHLLSNDLNIKSTLHCSKILREIQNLKHKISESSTNKSEQSDESLSEIIESQKAMIKDLTFKLNALQTNSTKKIKELQKKNKQLQDGY